MIGAWTKHLSDEKDKQRFQNEILSSRAVLERLSQILDELETDVENQELSTRAYDNANWAYRQAHANGTKSTLRKIKTLISLDQAKEQ